MRTGLGALAIVAVAGLAGCGGGSSSASPATTAPPSTAAGGSATPAAGSAFCSQVNSVLTRFQAITAPTTADITAAAQAFDTLAVAGPTALKASLSASAGDFRQLAALSKTDPGALTRENPTPQDSAVVTKLQGDLTPLVAYRKSNCPA